MTEFVSMGGYAAFIWPSFGVTAFVLVALVLQSRHRLEKLKTELISLESSRVRPRRKKTVSSQGSLV